MLGLEMSEPLYMDLRAYAMPAIDAGMSRRAAAKRFGLGLS
jgi:transposase